MIARAHQLMSKGFNKTHDDNIVTVFSAPNYCYRCGNQAAILDIDENLNQTYIQFDHAQKEEHNSEKRVPDYFL